MSPQYRCPDCDWTPPFPVEDEADWEDMLGVHRLVVAQDAVEAASGPVQ